MRKIICDNCIDAMKEIETESIDALITDSPYGKGFLGRGWDTFDSPQAFQKFSYEWSKEGNRVLKKGVGRFKAIRKRYNHIIEELKKE